MVSAPSVLSGAVALMSLSVKSSLAECDVGERRPGARPLGVVDADRRRRRCRRCVPRNLLGAVDWLGELDPGLMPRPVGIILAAGQRPVDAGRADFEPVGALDRVAASLPARRAARTAPRQRAQSSSVSWRVSGRSAMTCSVGSDVPPIIATRTRSKPRAFDLGLDQSVSAAMSVNAVLRHQNQVLSGRPRSGTSLSVI